tara:strand:+ start:3950 stop:4465 length:516 start_codon:yes stop_codon:yes gene_type:complete
MNRFKNNGVFFSLLLISSISIFIAYSAINNKNTAVDLSDKNSKVQKIEHRELKYAQFKKKDTKEIIILPIEIPKMKDYAVGLSDKEQVENFGMLFNFEQEKKYQGFSMKKTKFNLSIAFIDTNRTIVDIQEMQAFHNEIYISKYPFQYAIEAPEKWFFINNINIGDTVVLP